MPDVAIVTIIGAALTVLVIAAYLISTLAALARVYNKLREVIAGLPVVTEKTKPLGSVLGEINKDLAGVDEALKAVLARSR